MVLKDRDGLSLDLQENLERVESFSLHSDYYAGTEDIKKLKKFLVGCTPLRECDRIF